VRTNSPTAFGISLALSGACFMVAIASPSAQRRGNNNGNQGAPVGTEMLLANPDAYTGKVVTLTAGVEEVLSTTAFVVDQRKAVSATEMKAIGKPVLIIAPDMQARAPQKQYLLVRGTVVKFDEAALAKAAPGYKLDLSPEVGARYRGQPVVIAASVLNSVSSELAKKPVPPPTPNESGMSTAMKTINPAVTALRAAAQQSDAAAVSQNAAKLVAPFTQAETIWDSMGVSHAAQVARDAQGYAASVDKAAAAGDWPAVNLALSGLNATCGQCHGVYRDRLEDGTYRFKAGSF